MQSSMMSRKNKILLSLLAGTLCFALIGIRFYLQLQDKKKHITCLSAVIPTVVLHHQQEDIVQLLQGLADDVGETVPQKERSEKVNPMFSDRVDAALIEIAEVFKNHQEQASLSDTNVSKVVDKAVGYFKKDAPEFLSTCTEILVRAEKKCGPLDGVTENNRDCLNEFSPEITKLVGKYQTH